MCVLSVCSSTTAELETTENYGVLWAFAAAVCFAHLVRGPTMCVGALTPNSRQQLQKAAKTAAANSS